MSLNDIVNDFRAAQGWNDQTLLMLALSYIENQKQDDCFRDHLLEHAWEEPIEVSPEQLAIEEKARDEEELAIDVMRDAANDDRGKGREGGMDDGEGGLIDDRIPQDR